MKDTPPQWLITMEAGRKNKIISLNRHQIIFIMSYLIIVLVPITKHSIFAYDTDGHLIISFLIYEELWYPLSCETP